MDDGATLMKRDAVKYIRDKAKSAYDKDSKCYISGLTEDLELHHFNSVSILCEKFCKERGYKLDDVLEWRDEFISLHQKELYEDVVTLTKSWHKRLHSVYGVRPLPSTAAAQAAWCERQRNKECPG